MIVPIDKAKDKVSRALTLWQENNADFYGAIEDCCADGSLQALIYAAGTALGGALPRGSAMECVG